MGKTFVVERPTLIDFLQKLEASGAAPEARARNQRVAAVLNEVANFRRGSARPDPDRSRCVSPAAGGPFPRHRTRCSGQAAISYHGAEDLLPKLVKLSASATNDFPAFRSLYKESE